MFDLHLFLSTFMFLFIMILLLAYLIALVNRFTSFDEPRETVWLDPRDLRTGDLVGCAYGNFAGRFISAFSQSIWSHTGLVWKNPITGIPYIMEAANYRPYYEGGILIPFETWYTYNRKNVIAWCRYTGPPLNDRRVLQEFLPFLQDFKLEGLNPSWARFLKTHDYQSTGPPIKSTCFEVTIDHLQRVGVYAKSRLRCSYFPGDVINRRVEYAPGYSHAPALRFRLDPVLEEIAYYDKQSNMPNCNCHLLSRLLGNKSKLPSKYQGTLMHYYPELN